MFERMLKVKFVPYKNCFCYISPKSNILHLGKYVKLTYGEGRTAYFSVNLTQTSIEHDCIGISRIYAKSLGIQENENIIILEIPKPPLIKSMAITPTCDSDYEVLSLLADNVQSTLLDQISVVSNNQNIVVWIGRNIFVTLPVSEIKPMNLGCIDNFTEVVVKTPELKSLKKDTKDVKKVSAKNNEIKQLKTVTKLDDNSITHFIKLIQGYSIQNILLKNHNLYINNKKDLLYRLIPRKNEKILENLKDFLHPFNVFTTKKNMPQSWPIKNTKTTQLICNMQLLTTDIFPSKPIYVRLCLLEDYIQNFNDDKYENNLFVDDVLFKHFDCNLGARVILKYEPTVPYITEIHICAKKSYLVDVKDKFKEFVANSTQNQVLLLNPEVVFYMTSNIRCMIKLTPVEAPFCIMDENLARDCKYTLLDDVLRTKDLDEDKNSLEYTLDASNLGGIVQNIVKNFDFSRLNNFENVLLTGKSGTGKTTLTKILKEKLSQSPYYMYTETINCKNIKGKTIDSLLKVFSKSFADLVLHQPSILILDDLHVLCESVPGEEMAPNAIYFNRISEILHNLLKLFSRNNFIGILATTESVLKLNGNIYMSRGSHLFKNVFSIDAFNKDDRITLLKYLFSKYTLKCIDLDALSTKTEGYVIQDLINFVNKTVYEAYKDDPDGIKSEPTITEVHCEKGLKTTCVLSLHDVQLHSPGNKDFSDVGGLGDVKKILVESLLWPAQFPGIFADAPLRLQSGLLLYGPPGTGKTVLAGAAAKQCGLRLISIKGPELLSKYIGASEQAVRDVFEKAQSARPCILFFDEFDSLAPRRGQDTTGVTDRVVNQLLTQLDGVESLTGVCVLAATSRPDLLDPALLRPGRLDRQLLCPLPDAGSRFQILKCLSKTMDFVGDINLTLIATQTEGFSGADLQSVLYTAQLSSVENIILENSPKSSNSPKITQKHLVEALKKTRPSLTKQERAKYERIYAYFQGGYKEDFKAGSKATLA
ncbi:unnamed protein product [Brassicogethes aeneus]|uniref:Peroxisomal ATPase PEX1 n=1 Tax=Brassicogethes aeneus TaxID=1431903 RepID=A0A9P0B8P9_BRAAE|nr:unnamed protein product [Brassicogethes aeneus]